MIKGLNSYRVLNQDGSIACTHVGFEYAFKTYRARKEPMTVERAYNKNGEIIYKTFDVSERVDFISQGVGYMQDSDCQCYKVDLETLKKRKCSGLAYDNGFNWRTIAKEVVFYWESEEPGKDENTFYKVVAPALFFTGTKLENMVTIYQNDEENELIVEDFLQWLKDCEEIEDWYWKGKLITEKDAVISGDVFIEF